MKHFQIKLNRQQISTFPNRYLNESDFLKSQNLLGIIISNEKFNTNVPNKTNPKFAKKNKRKKEKQKIKKKFGNKDDGKW